MPLTHYPEEAVQDAVIASGLSKGPPASEQEAQRDADSEYSRMFDYAEAKIHLKRIIDSWSSEVARTEERRMERDVNVNTEALRQRGELDEDETLIPVRVIDTNIQRELPSYINYLKNSRRLCTFRSLDDPQQGEDQVQNLEIAFTQGMTYLEWEIPHYKCLDGASTHGWDAVEVVLDESKPLNVGVEHIGHDMLFFPRSNKNIQQAPRVIRAYDLTLIQLDAFVTKFGFSAEEVDLIKQSRKDNEKMNETVRIYKGFYKYQSQVYVCWFALEADNMNWLKKPELLDLGLIDLTYGTQTQQPKYPSQYPIFILPYRETEKPKLVDRKGRCFLDGPKQEAETAILSGYVNGLTRASNLYASVGMEDGTGAGLKELENTLLKGGRIFNKPLTFFNTDYPDPSVLKALQYFDTANAQETNQVNFAAMNREDSRKTAKEIETANNQQSLLNSVQLTLFSAFIRAVYSYAWLIVQSQALQNKIKFLQVTIQQPITNPLTGQPMIGPDGQPMTQPQVINNYKIIEQAYDVRAAGDVDVIQRQEKINGMMQDWPVISQTVLRDQFLAELIRLKYPDKGEQWAQVIMQNGQMATMMSLISRLSIMLKGTLDDAPDLLNKLDPQKAASVQQTLQEAMQFMPAAAAKALGSTGGGKPANQQGVAHAS